MTTEQTIDRKERKTRVGVVESNKMDKTITIKVNGHVYPLSIKDKYDELLHSLGMDKLHGYKFTAVGHRDLGRWGAHLPELIAAQAELQPWPWLADSARLDWARHTCERSADSTLATDSLQRLGDTPAEHLGLAWHPGVQVLDSPWPVVSLWRAHQLPEGPERDDALQGLRLHTMPTGECAVVWRHPWQAEVAVLTPPEAAWMRWWLDAPPEATLAQALAAMAAHADVPSGQGFDFGAWLARALSCGWLSRITLLPQA